METILERKKCTGCMACTNICSKKAIKIITEKDGFAYPKIDTKNCINCGLCKKICPVLNKLEDNMSEIEVYSCKNKNEEIRMQSSSGGIFTLIAEWILNQNGVVFGVKFNENMEVVHDYVETKEELELFRGSKYVQSQIGDTYQKAKEFLNQKRKVLFTGTPCQVEGLLSYLGKEYDNLYTQDLICHGVPSPKVWKKYLDYKKREKGEYPKKVNFRSKKLSVWDRFGINYQYSKIEEDIYHKEDLYMKLFLENFDLRESCYSCSFKKLKRKSDITVADFWGIDKVNSKFYDKKGVSAILVNSKKGKEVFNNIKDNMEFEKANIEDIIKCNIAINKSVSYNDKRKEFFKDLENENFEVLIQKYL